MHQVLVTMLSPAILAVFIVLGLWPAPSPPAESNGPVTTAPAVRTVDEPLPVAFRLRDGVQIRGQLTAWWNEGFDGTFGRRRWQELREGDAWRLYRSLIDEDDAASWVALGRTMLELALDQPRAASRADVAFRTAERLDPDQADAIQAARDAIERLRLERRAAEAAASEARLRTTDPEAQPWPATPWPPLDDAARAEAIETMCADAKTMLNRAGLALDPHETGFFLLYTDLDDDETARWARELDALYTRLATQFGLDANDNVFWGKAVVFIFADRDRFQLVEADAFDQLVRPTDIAMGHPSEAGVFITAHRATDSDAFASALAHETAHAFLHRYRTPRRLPPWANEGFAHYLATGPDRDSHVERTRRQQGIAFIRSGGNVNALLDLTYADETWPGPAEVGPAVGYLLVDLMIRERPDGFRRWVDAIKAETPWEEALRNDFGATRGDLVEVFVRYYAVND